jgi:hypothetical protein
MRHCYAQTETSAHHPGIAHVPTIFTLVHTTIKCCLVAALHALACGLIQLYPWGVLLFADPSNMDLLDSLVAIGSTRQSFGWSAARPGPTDWRWTIVPIGL